MPDVTFHPMGLRYDIVVRDGKFEFITEAQEKRVVYETLGTGETLILSAQKIPGTIHEQAVPIGNIMRGLGEN